MDIQEVILKVINKKEAVAEYQQLNVWKKETADNLKIYQEINKIVEEGSNLSDYKEYNVESGYERFKKQITPKSKPWLAYAAAAVLLLSACFYLFKATSTDNKTIAPQEYIAEASVTNLALNDGSTVSLNVGSELKELSDFTKVRNVELQGEAFFDITPDKDRPFRIHLEDEVFVEVLGTSFNILNDGTKLQVVVESGHVELHTDGKVISLTKGFAAERVKGSIVKYKKSKDNYLSWKNNRLVYKNTPIAKVLEDIFNHFNADLDLSEAIQNSDCNLSSTFDTSSLDQILSELSKVVKLKYTKNKDGSYSIKDIQCE